MGEGGESLGRTCRVNLSRPGSAWVRPRQLLSWVDQCALLNRNNRKQLSARGGGQRPPVVLASRPRSPQIDGDFSTPWDLINQSARLSIPYYGVIMRFDTWLPLCGPRTMGAWSGALIELLPHVGRRADVHRSVSPKREAVTHPQPLVPCLSLPLANSPKNRVNRCVAVGA